MCDDMSGQWKRKEFHLFRYIDEQDLKIYASEYDGKPFWLTIGISQSLKSSSSRDPNRDKRTLPRGTDRQDFEYVHLIRPEYLPRFLPVEQARDFVQGAIAGASGSLRVVTSSQKPALFDDEETLEEPLQDYFLSQERIDRIARLTSAFFSKRVRVELDYPHIFTGDQDYPTWEPIFSFTNLLGKATTISKAVLQANNSELYGASNDLGIELDIGETEVRRVPFYLPVPLDETEKITGSVSFEHTYGDASVDVDYEVNEILMESEQAKAVSRSAISRFRTMRVEAALRESEMAHDAKRRRAVRAVARSY